jgi:hypothetical protein
MRFLGQGRIGLKRERRKIALKANAAMFETVAVDRPSICLTERWRILVSK